MERAPAPRSTESLSFPEDTYLVDHARRLVYLPIPKVACTSLKVWFLRTSPDVGIDPDPGTWNVNGWLGADGNRYLLKETAPLRDGRYFRFAFVRNPWSRLVSAYLNRIVGQGVEYRRLMTRLSRGRWYRLDKRALYGVRRRITGTGWTQREELSFRQFVEREVTVSDPLTMDPHWRPQHVFLGPHAIDFTGRFERLDDDLDALRRLLAIEGGLPERNRSSYAARADGPCMADCPPSRLRAMARVPPWRHFYTADLVDDVARVYAEDVERFGYAF